jgi:hypothetical protein
LQVSYLSLNSLEADSSVVCLLQLVISECKTHKLKKRSSREFFALSLLISGLASPHQILTNYSLTQYFVLASYLRSYNQRSVSRAVLAVCTSTSGMSCSKLSARARTERCMTLPLYVELGRKVSRSFNDSTRAYIGQYTLDQLAPKAV